VKGPSSPLWKPIYSWQVDFLLCKADFGCLGPSLVLGESPLRETELSSLWDEFKGRNSRGGADPISGQPNNLQKEQRTLVC
jgi:hypothetical protein